MKSGDGSEYIDFAVESRNHGSYYTLAVPKMTSCTPAATGGHSPTGQGSNRPEDIQPSDLEAGRPDVASVVGGMILDFPRRLPGDFISVQELTPL